MHWIICECSSSWVEPVRIMLVCAGQPGHSSATTSNLDRHFKRKVHWTLGFVLIFLVFFLSVFLCSVFCFLFFFSFCFCWFCSSSAPVVERVVPLQMYLYVCISFCETLACYHWSVCYRLRFVHNAYVVCGTMNAACNNSSDSSTLFHSSLGRSCLTYVLIIAWHVGSSSSSRAVVQMPWCRTRMHGIHDKMRTIWRRERARRTLSQTHTHTSHTHPHAHAGV